MDTSLTRRTLSLGGTAAGGAALAPATAAWTEAQDARSPAVAPAGPAMTPDEALALLKKGNEDFLADVEPVAETGHERRMALAHGQTPLCAYVTCSDSRVPPELLFSRGLGELFIIRNAGNTLDLLALGSVEYAVAVLQVPLVVVMGHESCGAVDGAMQVVDKNARFPGAIGKMIEPIIPAVLASRGQQGDPLENAVKQNVRRVTRMLREDSDPIMLTPQRDGRLKVVGAYYELDSGRVDFFDTV